jgi:subtilisin family serine protease
MKNSKNTPSAITALGITLGLGLGMGWTITSQATETQNRYLVQYHSPTAVNSVAKQLKALKLDLRRGVVGSPTVRVMNRDLRVQDALTNTRMLVIEASASEAAALRNDPNVALVEKEIIYAAPEPMATRSAQALSLPNKEELTNEGEITWGLKAVKAPEAWKLLRNDKTRLAGRGTRVLVLDTGIDREHSDIKSRFEAGRNFLGKSGAPFFVESLFSSSLEPLDGAEGSNYDYYDDNGHGTHVAGTILGAYNGTGVSGVAPLANLLAGRVCGKFGCSSVGIVRGIEYGITQAVDVINMSLGGPVPSAASREAVAAADAANVVVVCASGNDGKAAVSFPAAYEQSVAVGAIDSSLARASFSNWGPELDIVAPGVDVLSSVPVGSGRESKVTIEGVINGVVKSKSFVGAEENATPITAQLKYVGLGKDEDFDGLNLTGQIALIRRGEITFKEKVNNALAANAAGVLIFNNEAGLISGALTQDGSSVGIPVAMIEKAVGEAIVASLNSGVPAKASLVVERTDYASFNGTSMASPHVAGVAALVKAANKKLTAPQLRQILKDSATPMQADPGRPNEFGAGLVNAESAVRKALSL